MGKIILNGIEYIGGEADNVFAPVIYSDNERVIGVWRDNKPLYQKTYHFNSLVTLNSNTWFDTGFKISDSVIVGNSVAFRDDNIAGQSFPVIASADIGTNQAIELLQTRNSSITISGFTIQYTKTTDTAGSGNWNTDGVPTHHYSTSEQVVGTWTDGKPIYERTFNPPIVVGNNTIAHGITDLKECISITGRTKYNNTNEVLPLPYVSVASNFVICLGNVNASTFLIESGMGFSSFQECFVTMRYTKTTD